MAQTAALLDSDTQQFEERRRPLRMNLLPSPTIPLTLNNMSYRVFHRSAATVDRRTAGTQNATIPLSFTLLSRGSMLK